MRRKILKSFVILCFLFCFLPISVNASSEQTAEKEETYSIFDVQIPFTNVYDCYRTTDVAIGWSQKVYKFEYPYNAITDKAISQEVPDAIEHPENYYYQFVEQKNGKIGLILYQFGDSGFQNVLSREGAILNYGEGCFLFHTNEGYGTFVSLREEPYHRHASDDCKKEHKAGNDTCVRCMRTKSGELLGKCGEKYVVEYINPDIEQLKKLPITSGMISLNEPEVAESVEEEIPQVVPEISEKLKDMKQAGGGFLVSGEPNGYFYNEEYERLCIDAPGTYRIASTEKLDAAIEIRTSGVTLILSGIHLSPDKGSAIVFEVNNKNTEAHQYTTIILEEGSLNQLTSNGGVAASAIENKNHPIIITCSLAEENHVCNSECGKLIAKADSLGGTGMNGNVTIQGGVIEAIGKSGPGIGGYWEDGNNITISGGIVTANGIGASGGYSNAENIVISGGTIETTYIGGGKYGKTEVSVEPDSGRKISVCDGIKHRFARNIKGSPFSERIDISEITRRATYIKIMEQQ